MAKTYTQKEADAIGSKLCDVSLMMVALHNFANSEEVDRNALTTAAMEFAKRSVHIIDACLGRLNVPGMGTWSEEFEAEQPEEEETHG